MLSKQQILEPERCRLAGIEKVLITKSDNLSGSPAQERTNLHKLSSDLTHMLWHNN